MWSLSRNRSIDVFSWSEGGKCNIHLVEFEWESHVGELGNERARLNRGKPVLPMAEMLMLDLEPRRARQ